MTSGRTAHGPTGFTEPAITSRRGSVILGGVIIVMAALAVYHNSFRVPFFMDDVPSIVENQTIRHLWPLWGGHYHPRHRLQPTAGLY